MGFYCLKQNQVKKMKQLEEASFVLCTLGKVFDFEQRILVYQ